MTAEKPVPSGIPGAVTLGSSFSTREVHPPALHPQNGQKPSAFYKQMADFAMKYGAAAIPCLKDFLKDSNWQTRCAALRALACTGSPEAAQILASFINNQASVEESAQAAMALGSMDTPGATQTLLQKYTENPAETLRSCLLDTLASRPYSETASFFQNYLNSGNNALEEKADVITALGFHKQAPLELITPYLHSTDEDLRSGAYQALAFRGNSSQGQLLLTKVDSEATPATRGYLYEAIGAQKDVPAYQIAQTARQETDPNAQLRAFKAWGAAVGRSQDAGDRREFANSAVPSLVENALSNPDPGERRAALQALASSRTSEAQKALDTISKKTSSQSLSKLAKSLSTSISETIKK